MKYPRPPFDTVAEIQKMRMFTNLPITDIVFLNPAQEFELKQMEDPWPTETAELYIGGTVIGNINYMIISGVIGCNDTIERLDWNKIYNLCQNDLFPLIQTIEPRVHTIRPIRYHVVSAFDIDGTELTHINCYYRDGWHVNLMGLNYVERSMTTQVTLTPPPPRDI